MLMVCERMCQLPAGPGYPLCCRGPGSCRDSWAAWLCCDVLYGAAEYEDVVRLTAEHVLPPCAGRAQGGSCWACTGPWVWTMDDDTCSGVRRQLCR